MAANKFMVKKAELDLLEQMYRILEREKEDVAQTWGKTGNKVQSKKWDRENDKWIYLEDDDGNPIMEDECGSIPKPEDEYTDNDRAKLKAIENLTKKLEGMM